MGWPCPGSFLEKMPEFGRPSKDSIQGMNLREQDLRLRVDRLESIYGFEVALAWYSQQMKSLNLRRLQN